ncbi:hypothetical protein JDV02_006376 [Purpureocillium takamizusanense]|uniref:Uncharacterized protein n=1 Tax=Purpureocillium takamizusanense TaxID=2060973 RepID=A0A9Q8QG66_9HYPO|nr:uncharacterized protein JDV02_006376 [Purpureocillium takamizusanense]UNI20274.1 hypothetical protein JDV02_006376 [Purpureocillium takamizusanense]
MTPSQSPVSSSQGAGIRVACADSLGSHNRAMDRIIGAAYPPSTRFRVTMIFFASNDTTLVEPVRRWPREEPTEPARRVRIVMHRHFRGQYEHVPLVTAHWTMYQESQNRHGSDENYRTIAG